MIERLVMISKEYPTDTDPIYSYVDQLACGLADAGIEVTVVAPLSLTRTLLRGKPMPPARLIKRTEGGAALTVLRPRTISLSDGRLFGIDMAMLTHGFFRRAVRRALRDVARPDALYGHFIALSGMCAAELGRAWGIPSFLGYGESSPKRYAQFSKRTLTDALRLLSGVVAVSSENARELRAEGITAPGTRFGVFPNAVNAARFHPIERGAAREALGFDRDAFIISFVGAFSERKGTKLLSDALKMMPGVQSIFIGQGGLRPDCPGMLHCGPLPNDRVPRMLAASDVFVLPTLAEGCCNAIVEALSMGLPVISSALPFNDDILGDDCAILVDPTDAGAIAATIAHLRDDPALRAKLAAGALERGRSLTMPQRVRGILAFMNGAE